MRTGYAARFSVLPFPVKSALQYGQISLPTFTVLEQYGHGAYPTGVRSLADGKSPTTRKPTTGEQNKAKKNHRMPSCPLLSARSPTTPQRKIHTKDAAIAMTNEVMAHPHGRRLIGSHQLCLYDRPGKHIIQ